MSETVRVKMDEVVNSIAMIAEYKAKADLRIATLAARVKALEAGVGEMRKALEVVGLAWEIEVRGKPDNDGSVTDMVTEALGTARAMLTQGETP